MKFRPNLELDPFGEPAKKLLEMFRADLGASRTALQERQTAWTRVEELYWGTRKSVTKSEKEGAADNQLYVPDQYSDELYVPIQNTIFDSIATYYWTAMFSKDPAIVMRATGPEHEVAAEINTQFASHQSYRRKFPLKFYKWAMDVLVYGHGILKVPWIEDYTFFTDDDGNRQPLSRYKGNDFINVNPRFFGHDPNVSIGNMQDGEFVFQRMALSKMFFQTQEAEQRYVGLDKMVDQAGQWNDRLFSDIGMAGNSFAD